MAHELFCKSCGKIAKPRKLTKGSFLIELILWLCFLIPGIIYSIWRLTSRTFVCPYCESEDLIGKGSPVAKHMMENMNGKKCPHCSETIKKGATTCRFCNNDVPVKKRYECLVKTDKKKKEKRFLNLDQNETEDAISDFYNKKGFEVLTFAFVEEV